MDRSPPTPQIRPRAPKTKTTPRAKRAREPRNAQTGAEADIARRQRPEIVVVFGIRRLRATRSVGGRHKGPES